MTNKIRKLAALTLVATLSLSILVGCSSKVSGRYYFVSMETDGMTITSEAIAAALDPETLYIEFNGNNFTLSMVEERREGTFTQKGSEVTLSFGDEFIDDGIIATVDGRQITFDFSDTVLIFEKK